MRTEDRVIASVARAALWIAENTFCIDLDAIYSFQMMRQNPMWWKRHLTWQILQR